MERRLSDPAFTKAMEYVQTADFFPARAREPGQPAVGGAPEA
jgi:hypothetical protein